MDHSSPAPARASKVPQEVSSEHQTLGRRDESADPSPERIAAEPADPPDPPSRWARLVAAVTFGHTVLSLVIAAVTVVGIAAGGLALYASPGAEEKEGPLRYVTIVHTPNKQGIRGRTGPSKTSSHAQPKRVLTEGQVVGVVCQVRTGEALSLPGEGRPAHAVAVWDKLASGEWINDVFTNLPRKKGSVPPKGIQLCPEEG